LYNTFSSFYIVAYIVAIFARIYQLYLSEAMDIVKSQVMELKKLWKNKRQLAFQALNLAMIVFSAL
jgi:hypothetical protein